jgi:predicted house-cleaning NTP pyrophosphatase (Maf/HAM1 superfamily)
MAKEKEQAQQAQQPASEATVPADSSAVIESPVILRAKSREELDQQFQDMKAKYDGHTLTAGAVARSKDDGTYILRVDII